MYILTRILCVVALAAAAIINGLAYAQSMSPSGPAPMTVDPGEPLKSLFVDTREQDFSDAQRLVLQTPTDAEKRLNNTGKSGVAMAIGFIRTIPLDKRKVSAQQLSGVSTGVLRVTVGSISASSLRVALDLATLPLDAIVSVRGSDDFTRLVVAGKVRDLRKLATQQGYWTPATQGELQYIEVAIPTSSSIASPKLGVNSLSHITVKLSQINSLRLDVAKVGESSSCEINVVCQSTSDIPLGDSAKAVARMIFTTTTGSFLCTGTALNDNSGTFNAPYFYSANHCISSQAVASTLNTFWFYDSPTCPNGTTVGSFVQRTGGAIYVFSDATSDASLLRLNDPLPGGAALGGWDAGVLADGVAITGIHHPAGDVKKVSRGQTKSAGCIASRSCVGWSQGTTEGGSSGSGLFTLVSGGYYLRGGLYGGSASCANSGTVSNTANTDQYSRFSAVYASIAPYLTPSTTTNDYFVNAFQLNGVPVTTTGSNVGATKELGEPNHSSQGGSSNPGGASVWWRWTAPATGAVTVSTAGSSFDTLLGVYTGTSVGGLTRVTYTQDYSDDIPSGLTSSVSFQATAGVTYRIAVDGYGAATGTISLAITASITPVLSTTASDLNGDGRSDLIWYNAASGSTAAWLMNGFSPTTTATLYSGAFFGWKPVATGDFNGDGKGDIVWYNPTTGQSAIWLMNGLSQIASAVIYSDSPSGWRPVAAGDLDGDGRADLVWWNPSTGQSAAWLMNGLTQIGGAILFGSSPNGWRPVATGDLNGDGKADIIWYHPTAGQTAAWLMNGLSAISAQVINVDVVGGWRPVDLGDMNGDGKADILWYNPATGQTATWTMNGLTQTAGAVIYVDATGGWQPQRLLDLNGDGKSDIVWLHLANGWVATWLMNGNTTISSAVIYNAGGGWRPMY